MTPAVIASAAHLFDIRPALRYTQRFHKYGLGEKEFAGPNPPNGALVTYYLKDKPVDKAVAKIEVLDSSSKVIRELKNIPKEKGMNRASWDLRYEGPRTRRPPTEEEMAFSSGPVGPRVVPGTYSIRLTVGDKVLEKKVEVRLDPSISVPAADLQTQLDQALKLRDMQSALTDGIRALDSLKEQLQQIEKTVKDRMAAPPEELLRAIKDSLGQIEKLQSGLFRGESGLGLSGGARFYEAVGGLFGDIDGVNAAPTPAQREYFLELQKEFPERASEINRFINEAVPKLNDTLRKHNAPTVIAGKPVDSPR
jgi:hypothetical protein